MPEVMAVIAAAGSGSRMGKTKAKQYLDLCGQPILTRSCRILEKVPEIKGVVLVVPQGCEESTYNTCVKPYGLKKVVKIVAGGKERTISVDNGVQVVKSMGGKYVLIHDAARPLAEPELFSQVLSACREYGAAVAAAPCFDTIKQADESKLVQTTLDRTKLWMALTPQGFEVRLLSEVLKKAISQGKTATDEAGLMEWMGNKVKIVPSSRENLKITTKTDLRMAQGYLMAKAMPRIGQGIDVHRLVKGRRLVLGGVSIDYELGLLGHSDADVLTHAVMDALLSACGLGDIGRLFPDNDPRYKDADSLDLLKKVCQKMAEKGWCPLQVNVTLMAEKPKIAPYSDLMRENLAKVMGLSKEDVNVAATTCEKMGFTGRQEGMQAMAQAMVIPL